MRTLLPLGALLAMVLTACSEMATSPTADPTNTTTALACAGNSGNCGGGQHNNNPNNPPSTAP
jgi:hypothetical protein